MDVRAGLIFAVGIAAVVQDVKSRNISNWTTGGAALAGLIVNTVRHGLPGLGDAALGMVFGFVVFLVFYVLGGMGGGDIKLMAGFGSLLGSGQIWNAALMTAICGGVMALLYLGGRAAWRWARPQACPEAGQLEATGAASAKDSIPYAPAITLGVWLTLISEF